MIRRQLFRKFILFRNFGRKRVLREGNTDCQEAGELEVTFRCFIAFWLLEHCQNYNNTTMPNIQSIQIMIRMSTHCPFWGFEDSSRSQARSLCNVILIILAAHCSGSPIVQSGRDKLKTIPPLTWCLMSQINVANPEYLSGDICISICCWAQDFIMQPSSLYISVLDAKAPRT